MCTSDLRYACPWKMASQQTMQIDSLKTSVESLKTCWVSPESLNPIPGRCPISEVRMAPFSLQLLLSHLRWQNVTLLRHECLDKRPVCRYACPTDAAIRPRIRRPLWICLTLKSQGLLLPIPPSLFFLQLLAKFWKRKGSLIFKGRASLLAPHCKVLVTLDGSIGVVECDDTSMVASALAASDAPTWLHFKGFAYIHLKPGKVCIIIHKT